MSLRRYTPGTSCLKIIRNSAIFITYAIYIMFIGVTPICALEEGYTNFCRNLIISQEKYQAGSILISRPSPLDEKIRDVIIYNNIRTLQDYIHWLQENIKYKRDEGQDSWSAPQETLQKKFGDCEDIAFLNAAFLRVVGYQPKVLGVMKGFGRNHAICVFEEDGYYLWIDNTELKKTQAESILQFAKHILIKYNCRSLRELHLQTKDWDIVYIPNTSH